MGGETKVIFTDIPEVSSLSYYLGMIDPTEQKDKSAPTDYQWQILKSRYVFTFFSFICKQWCIAL